MYCLYILHCSNAFILFLFILFLFSFELNYESCVYYMLKSDYDIILQIIKIKQQELIIYSLTVSFESVLIIPLRPSDSHRVVIVIRLFCFEITTLSYALKSLQFDWLREESESCRLVQFIWKLDVWVFQNLLLSKGLTSLIKGERREIVSHY